jgi:hypothetical protein
VKSIVVPTNDSVRAALQSSFRRGVLLGAAVTAAIAAVIIIAILAH